MTLETPAVATRAEAMAADQAAVAVVAEAEVINQTLIASVEAFDIDGDLVQMTFARRLAKEQGWTLDFADRAIREYKRFVILAMISESPVTPSLIIDEAWHLHLIYTRSYWERFMPLLPRLLHHEPTTGGVIEATKHETQFKDTLDLYRLTFGVDAPADIWNPQREAKPIIRKAVSWKSIAAGSGLLLAGCTTVAQINQPNVVLAFFGIVILFVGVWLMSLLAIVVGAIFGATRMKKGGRHSNSGMTNHSTYSSSDSSSSNPYIGSSDSSDASGGSHCSSNGHCSSHSGSSCSSSSSSCSSSSSSSSCSSSSS